MKVKITDNFYLLFCFLLIAWGSYAAVSKFVLNRLDAFQVQFYSYGIASCIMLAALIRSKKFTEMKSLLPKQWGIIMICALTSCAYTYLYNSALSMADELHITTVVMINNLYPLFVAIFAVPINGEHLNARKIVSLLIGLCGAFTAVAGGSEFVIDAESLPMYMLVLTAAVSWGVFSGFGKKNSVPMVISNFVYVFVGFIVSTVLLPLNSSFVAVEFDLLIVVSWLGLTNFILGVFIWLRLLKISASSKVASLSLITPVVSLMFVKLLFPDTQIGIYHVIGLVLILIGVALQRNNKKVNAAKL